MCSVLSWAEELAADFEACHRCTATTCAHLRPCTLKVYDARYPPPLLYKVVSEQGSWCRPPLCRVASSCPDFLFTRQELRVENGLRERDVRSAGVFSLGVTVSKLARCDTRCWHRGLHILLQRHVQRLCLQAC